jgi:hypothetical protein
MRLTPSGEGEGTGLMGRPSGIVWARQWCSIERLRVCQEGQEEVGNQDSMQSYIQDDIHENSGTLLS